MGTELCGMEFRGILRNSVTNCNGIQGKNYDGILLDGIPLDTLVQVHLTTPGVLNTQNPNSLLLRAATMESSSGSDGAKPDPDLLQSSSSDTPYSPRRFTLLRV